MLASTLGGRGCFLPQDTGGYPTKSELDIARKKPKQSKKIRVNSTHMPLYASAGALFAQIFFWRKIVAKYLRCDGFTSKLRLLIEMLKNRAKNWRKISTLRWFHGEFAPIISFFHYINLRKHAN